MSEQSAYLTSESINVSDFYLSKLVDCYASYFVALTRIAWSFNGWFILVCISSFLFTLSPYR